MPLLFGQKIKSGRINKSVNPNGHRLEGGSSDGQASLLQMPVLGEGGELVMNFQTLKYKKFFLTRKKCHE